MISILNKSLRNYPVRLISTQHFVNVTLYYLACGFRLITTFYIHTRRVCISLASRQRSLGSNLWRAQWEDSHWDRDRQDSCPLPPNHSQHQQFPNPSNHVDNLLTKTITEVLLPFTPLKYFYSNADYFQVEYNIIHIYNYLKVLLYNSRMKKMTSTVGSGFSVDRIITMLL